MTTTVPMSHEMRQLYAAQLVTVSFLLQEWGHGERGDAFPDEVVQTKYWELVDVLDSGDDIGPLFVSIVQGTNLQPFVAAEAVYTDAQLKIGGSLSEDTLLLARLEIAKHVAQYLFAARKKESEPEPEALLSLQHVEQWIERRMGMERRHPLQRPLQWDIFRIGFWAPLHLLEIIVALWVWSMLTGT